MSQNEDDSVGSEIEKDFGISTKSTGSEVSSNGEELEKKYTCD